MDKVRLYDTTLRDGAQGEGISFSLKDKIRIAKKLDEIGIRYIEGGWPGSNPKDIDFFKAVKKLRFKNAVITAFGSTRRAHTRVSDDANIKAIIRAGTKVATIFGKTWKLHVRDVLKISYEENLKMISDTVSYLKSKGLLVIYDAEHFFDGYLDDPEYAISTLAAAEESGADELVLCDTNGGVITSTLLKIIREVKTRISMPLGIHTHNDNGMAVANTIAAVEEGLRHVQGTINGYGERCGNADLCVVIPNIRLKLRLGCIPDNKLKELTEVSRFVDELANVRHQNNRPFVGSSAFAHKGGMHVNAVQKNPRSFEHIEPEKVGNARRILVSELSGKTNILLKAKEMNLELDENSRVTHNILKSMKQLEHEGFQFESAEGSFELLIKKAIGKHKRFFDLEGFRVIIEKREDNQLLSEATIKLKVKGIEEHTASEGDGPINALDNAIRKALEEFYPSLKEMRLTDFKVRVLDEKAGTAARVRVLIQSQDKTGSWWTVGVSENVIEASWQALVDSIEYKLLKDRKDG